MIENEIPFINTSTLMDSPELVINRNTSYYTTNSNDLSTSKFINMVTKYDLKGNVEEISDTEIILSIPSSVHLVENSVKIDGVICTDYIIADKLLIIPITNTSGTIRFSLSPTEATKLSSYARLSYRSNGTTTIETFGIINSEMPILTLVADNTTNTGKVSIAGIGPSNEDVYIYVADEKVTNVATSKSGRYEADITIPNPENGTTYTITARSYDFEGNNISVSTKVRYDDSLPVLSKLDLFYDNAKYTLTDPSIESTVLIFRPSTGYTFKAEFTNPEEIDNVYICSTRNNITKSIEAKWDELSKSFIANGLFDPNDRNYVPGLITVEYMLKYYTKTIAPGDDIDFSSPVFSGSILEDLKDSEIEILRNEDDYFEADIFISEKVEELAAKELKLVIKTIDKEYSADITGIMDGYSKLLKYFTKDENGKMYATVIDDTFSKKLTILVHDITDNKLIETIIEVADESVLPAIESIVKISGFMKGYLSIQDEYEVLTNRINSRHMTLAERELAFKKVKELRTDREAFLGLSTIITLVTLNIGTGGMVTPALVLSLIY